MMDSPKSARDKQANELGRKDVFFEAVALTEVVVGCGPQFLSCGDKRNI